MKKLMYVVCGLSLLMWVGELSAVTTVTLTSSNFSLGYGFTYPDWNTSETSSVNTSTNQGLFSFSPYLFGGINAANGPSFPDRVLSNRAFPGFSYSGWAVTFTNVLQGSWLGGVPADTVSEVPVNFRIRLNITQISIYGQPYTTAGGMGFSEITSGHATNSPTTTLGGGYAVIDGTNTWDLASNYTHVVWDAPDYEVAGTNFSRTFVLLGSSAGVLDSAVDGFEILGNVQILYDIPESSTLQLVSLGVTAFWFCRLHVRRNAR